MRRGAVRDVKRTAMNLPTAPPILPHSNSCLGSTYVASRTFVGIESTLHGLYSPMRLRPEDGTLPSPPIPGKSSLDRHHRQRGEDAVAGIELHGHSGEPARRGAAHRPR